MFLKKNWDSMKYLIKIIFISLLVSLQLSAQDSLSILVPDFQANKNRGTATLRGHEFLYNTHSGYSIAWRDSRNGDEEIFAQKYDSTGQKTGNNYEVQSWGYNLKEIYFSDGSFDRIWYSDNTIYFRKLDNEGNPIGELFSINDNNFVNVGYFDAAKTDMDGIFLVWSAQKTNSSYRIYAQKFDSNLQPIGDYFVPIRSFVGGDFIYPKIKNIKNGKYVLLYQQYVPNQDHNSIFLNLYDSTYIYQHDIRVNDIQQNIWGTKEWGNQASLGIDTLGNIDVIFLGNDDNIYIQNFDLMGNKINNNFGLPIKLEYYPTGIQSAVAASGFIFVLYSEKFTHKLYGQIINGWRRKKTKVNRMFISEGDNYVPSSVISNNLKFVITWEDNNVLYQKAVDSTFGLVYENIIPNNAKDISASQYRSSIGVINNKFLVLWNDNSDGTTSINIFGNLYSISGDKFTNEKLIFNKNGSFQSSFKPHVSYSLNQYLLSYTSDVYPQTLKFFNEKFEKVRDSVFINSQGLVITGENDINDNNYFVSVFEQDAFNNPAIYLQVFKPDGSFFHPKELVDDNIIVNDRTSPDCAISNERLIFITWSGKLPNSNNVDILMRKYYPDVTEIGTVTVVNDDNGNEVINKELQMSMNHTTGNFVVTWSDNRNGNWDIFAQRFNEKGGKISGNFQVNEEITGSTQTQPAVSMDRNDNFVITWTDTRNTTSDIYAQIYLPDGEPWGNNFRVNSDTIRVQKLPSVAFADNKLYFSWTSNHTQGTGYNIFAKVFGFGLTETLTEVEKKSPDSYSLNVYPNPFNTATQIKYTIPKESRVDISVYNIQGKTIKVLRNMMQSAGKYQLSFESNSFPSGVYFIVLQVNNKPVLTKKIVHLK